MSNIETKKVDMGDGDEAVIYTELKHGTARRVQQITRHFVRQDTTGKIGKNKPRPKINWDKAEWAEADDELILGQTVEWSFGEVNQEALDEMSEAKRDILLRAIDEEIKAHPLPESGGGD